MLTHETTVHDLIEVSGRKVGDTPRTGRILEVLGAPDHVHYRVCWEDGHESVFYPGGDSHVHVAAPEHVQHGAAASLVELLRAAGIEFEVLPHRRTLSAEREAAALGILPQETAKTVIVRSDGSCIRALVPASQRLSLEKLGREVGGRPTLLTEAELDGSYPEFELGAVPPFGGPAGDRVVVDAGLVQPDYVVLEAGVHDVSFRLRPQDLIALTGAVVADIAAGQPA
jgi:Ala-tRNA(Pro) deacylase